MWPGYFEVLTRIDCHLPARETLPAGGCRELFTGSGGHLRDAERLGIAFGSRRIRGQSRVTSAQGRTVGCEGPKVRVGAIASSAIRRDGWALTGVEFVSLREMSSVSLISASR